MGGSDWGERSADWQPGIPAQSRYSLPELRGSRGIVGMCRCIKARRVRARQGSIRARCVRSR
jgi:hypothetical protein